MAKAEPESAWPNHYRQTPSPVRAVYFAGGATNTKRTRRTRQVETVENFDANNFAHDVCTGRLQERVDREAGAAYDAIAARVRTHFAACTVPG